MNLRDACRQLERYRDRLDRQLADGKYSFAAEDVLRVRLAALDEILPIAQHEADLRAVDAAKNRARYGVHHLPLAAP